MICAGLITACASHPADVVTQVETVEVVKDRYVPIPSELTLPAPAPDIPSGEVSTLVLGALYKATRAQLGICNEQLSEISRLGEQPQE